MGCGGWLHEGRRDPVEETPVEDRDRDQDQKQEARAEAVRVAVRLHDRPNLRAAAGFWVHCNRRRRYRLAQKAVSHLRFHGASVTVGLHHTFDFAR